MKPIHIRLTQNEDGTFTVKGFTNTDELHVGKIVQRASLEKWVATKGVFFSVDGMTTLTETEKQPELFKKPATKAHSNGIAMAR